MSFFALLVAVETISSIHCLFYNIFLSFIQEQNFETKFKIQLLGMDHLKCIKIGY